MFFDISKEWWWWWWIHYFLFIIQHYESCCNFVCLKHERKENHFLKTQFCHCIQWDIINFRHHVRVHLVMFTLSLVYYFYKYLFIWPIYLLLFSYLFIFISVMVIIIFILYQPKTKINQSKSTLIFSVLVFFFWVEPRKQR